MYHKHIGLNIVPNFTEWKPGCSVNCQLTAFEIKAASAVRKCLELCEK